MGLIGLMGLMWCGCAHTPPKVISPVTDVTRVTAGTNFVPQVDGYFVPDARMLQLLDRLSEKDVFGK